MNQDKHIVCADCTLIGTMKLLDAADVLKRWTRHSNRTKKGGTRFTYTCGPCSVALMERKTEEHGQQSEAARSR